MNSRSRLRTCGSVPAGPGWNLPGREARWRSAHLARLSALLITRGVLADGAPDPLGGGWHIDICDAEWRERIEDRVDYGLRRSHAAGLACPLDAERVYFGWQLGEG